MWFDLIWFDFFLLSPDDTLSYLVVGANVVPGAGGAAK